MSGLDVNNSKESCTHKSYQIDGIVNKDGFKNREQTHYDCQCYDCGKLFLKLITVQER